jgi:hypothetical protein
MAVHSYNCLLRCAAAAAEGCPTSKDENNTHEPQSLWFCGFAILTLSWGVGLIAYGLYFFNEEF